MKGDPQADLHLHTNHSDGSYTPAELIRRAQAANLAAISITDHDTVSALAEAARLAGDDLELISGTELTVASHGRELHLLGYGLNPEDPDFGTFLAGKQARRVRRIEAMIRLLQERGIRVTLAEVQAAAGGAVLGRPHLAEVLLRKKIVNSFSEAFRKYLGDDAPCFTLSHVPSLREGVERVHAAGGLAVLAHPHRLIREEWLPELVASGLDGIEVIHSDHDAAVREKYLRFTERNGLLATGGSDCHGDRRDQGPTIGTIGIPYAWVERLKERLKR